MIPRPSRGSRGGDSPNREARIDRTKLIYLAITLVTIALTFSRPAVSVGLLMCTYGLEQWAQSQSSFFWAHGALTNALTAAVAGLGLVVHLKNGRPIFSTLPREFWLVAGLFMWCTLSVVWSVYPSVVFPMLSGSLQYILPFTLIMPLVVSNVRDARQMMFSVLTIGSILCFLILATSTWNGRSIMFQTGSTFTIEGLQGGNPLAIGNLGAYVALTALLMNFRGAARLWQILRYVVIGLGITVCVKSGSRGQTFGLGLAALIFLPYSRRFKDLTGFLGFAISIVLFAAVAFVLVDQLTRDTNNERSGRWTMGDIVNSYQGARVGTASRVLGFYIDGGPLVWLLGLGSSASFDPVILGSYPHMVPAEALAELGVPGFTMYCLVIYFSIVNLRELWPTVRDDAENRGIVATIGAFVFLETFLTFKEGSLLGSTSFFGIAILLGNVAMNARRELAYYRELDDGGYVLTADELAHEAAMWDEPGDDAHRPLAAGHA